MIGGHCGLFLSWIRFFSVPGKAALEDDAEPEG